MWGWVSRLPGLASHGMWCGMVGGMVCWSGGGYGCPKQPITPEGEGQSPTPHTPHLGCCLGSLVAGGGVVSPLGVVGVPGSGFCSGTGQYAEFFFHAWNFLFLFHRALFFEVWQEGTALNEEMFFLLSFSFPVLGQGGTCLYTHVGQGGSHRMQAAWGTGGGFGLLQGGGKVKQTHPFS